MSTYRKFDKRRADSAFAHLYNDFMAYTAGDWTISSTGALTAAISTTKPGGVLEASVASGAGNFTSWRSKAPFTFVRGKKLQAIAVVHSDDFAKNTSFSLGFANGSAGLSAAAVSFLVIAGNGKISRRVGTDLMVTGYDQPIADGDTLTLEVYYDGADAIQFYVNGTRVAHVSADEVGPADNTPLFLAFGVGETGEAAIVKRADIDFVGAAQER